jgi:hypothetical protein
MMSYLINKHYYNVTDNYLEHCNLYCYNEISS